MLAAPWLLKGIIVRLIVLFVCRLASLGVRTVRGEPASWSQSPTEASALFGTWDGPLAPLMLDWHLAHPTHCQPEETHFRLPRLFLQMKTYLSPWDPKEPLVATEGGGRGRASRTALDGPVAESSV